MSDSKNYPKPPPPDDFSKTTPNIPISDRDKSSNTDWEKTNYKYPAQPAADDWGNTVANIRPTHNDDSDFGKTYMPSANKPKTPDWGITQGDIKMPDNDFGGKTQNSGEADFGATTPYFRLPEVERAKYEKIPLTPTQEAEKQKQEEKEKGGIPSWVWISGGLMSMFLFALLVLLIVFIFFMNRTGFEATVKGAPSGSSILIDGAYWGVSDGKDIALPSLKSGETKKVEIVHPNYICEPRTIKGEDGVKPEPIIAQCKQVDKPRESECINIKAGAYDVAEKCANKALDDLSANYTVDDLLRAMNLYIIQFASGKYDIPDRNMKFLERSAGFMKKLPPTVVVEVGGHTDSAGTDANNQTLSDNRAKAVREALIKFGITPEMLTEKGYGESKPKATNDTEDGKFQNRRIEYTAVKK